MAQNLFDEFDEVSSKAWKQKIQYDLKGADYNENLVWESPEGIKVKPFYHADDLNAISVGKINHYTNWKIGQEIVVVDARNANQKALDILSRGAECLIFNISSEEVIIEDLLSGVDLNIVPIQVELMFLSSKYLQKISAFAANSVDIHLNVDVIGHFARTGNWFFDHEKDFKIVEDNIGLGSTLKNVLSIDMSLYQNAGANIVQQLAYAMAHANEYLSSFENNGEILKGVQGINFKVSVGPNYFFEIAKLKALRLLWQVLTSEYGISPKCHILAHPTKRNKTLYDYNINMLRTTAECMSAILGGADTVYNMPYDIIYHKPNEFGERIARNQLLAMKYESFMDKVGNPADGSYYIETLTQQLAEKALQLFKNIEAGGGFLKQLKDNVIQRKIRESAKKEQEQFDKKEEILVGTNAYKDKKDRIKGNLELHPLVKIDIRKTLIEPILEKRLAEDLEQKHLKNE